jgi:hypothetical protein
MNRLFRNAAAVAGLTALAGAAAALRPGGAPPPPAFAVPSPPVADPPAPSTPPAAAPGEPSSGAWGLKIETAEAKARRERDGEVREEPDPGTV